MWFFLIVLFAVVIISVCRSNLGVSESLCEESSYDPRGNYYDVHNDWNYNRRGRVTGYNENDR